VSTFKIAILGCGTVGGGVARIFQNINESLSDRAGRKIELVRILDLFPAAAAQRHGLPRELFCGTTDEIDKQAAEHYTSEILTDPKIDLIVETIGGSSDALLHTVLRVLESGKHLVTANKALLAKANNQIFAHAFKNGRAVGFEAAVCGAIPVIKGINECMTGDRITRVAGIMNGTSNYILSRMTKEGLTFADALQGAQKMGYAEADPSLDINGGDAGHKLLILLKIIYAIDAVVGDFSVLGIDGITADDTRFAEETDSVIKLICYAKKDGEGVYATVRPMMVKKNNVLSDINGATNAVALLGDHSQENIFIGQGAGSLETGSAIVSDIIFIARYGSASLREYRSNGLKLLPFEQLRLPYTIIFDTEDRPGITGIIATAVGREEINIDTMTHNLRPEGTAGALFAITTKPTTLTRIKRAVDAIRAADPKALLANPKIIPILE